MNGRSLGDVSGSKTPRVILLRWISVVIHVQPYKWINTKSEHSRHLPTSVTDNAATFVHPL